VALLCATHAIVLRHFYPVPAGQHSSLCISAHGPTFSLAVREAVEKSPAARKLAGLIKGWQKKLPKQPEELWGWLAKQKAGDGAGAAGDRHRAQRGHGPGERCGS